MAYVGFKASVKKVNLKPKGVTEITLEVPSHRLDGQIGSLSRMVDSLVEANLELALINYNVTINAETDRPVKEYNVDNKGIVSEVKPEGDQQELFPRDEAPTREEEEITERDVVDKFIASGLAPTYDDLKYDFMAIIKKHDADGVSYFKIASDLDISSGKLADDLDEFRERVAPLAVKWWDWKQQQVSLPESDQEEKSENAEPENQTEGEDKTEEDDTSDGAA